MIYHDGYCDFKGLEKTVRKTCKILREHRDEFDVLIVQGVSGQAVGFPVALRLRVPLVVLRKNNEDCHSTPGEMINRSVVRGARVLFLDDFISSGSTRDRCLRAVRESGGQLVGSCTYRRGLFTTDLNLTYENERYSDALPV
jgi:adenine/guanine phosphoribosyltransferase-like PRPP-binding protein